MSFVYTLLFVASVFGTLYIVAWRKKRRLSATNWEQLVRQLEEVPTSGISRIALDYLQPTKGQLAIQTDEMWWLIGGSEGLRRMQANVDILLQLASFAQQWNIEESVIVGERMRREGLVLRKAVGKIQWGLMFGYAGTGGPFSVQEAASAYYLMRQRLLALYEAHHRGRYCRLSIALGDPMAACGRAV